MTEKTKTKLIELSSKNCQIYKTFPIFSQRKTLATRLFQDYWLKSHLEKMMSPNQATFIKGNWINENVMLAQEIVNKKNTTQFNKGQFRIKTGLSNAFDRVKGCFLE